MPQSPDFFALLFQFAETLGRRVGQSPESLVWWTTPLPKSLGIGEPFDDTNPKWTDFMSGLRASEDPAAYTHAYYAARIGPDAQLGDETFHGYPLFGPFYYQMRTERIVRPHVAKLQPYASSFLDRERRGESRAWLRQMFMRIHADEPQAAEVLGNSWMYNVPAYRELFPPEFTTSLPESEEDEFQFLALWGQFFDRHWRVKPDLAQALLANVGQLRNLDRLGRCFPLKVLKPRAPIAPFYAFYGVTE